MTVINALGAPKHKPLGCPDLMDFNPVLAGMAMEERLHGESSSRVPTKSKLLLALVHPGRCAEQASHLGSVLWYVPRRSRV